MIDMLSVPDAATPWRPTARAYSVGRHGVAALLLLVTSVVRATAAEPAAPHWSYEGEAGPEHWADLSPAYSDADGKNQSPIDLVPAKMIEAELPGISFSYSPTPLVILNNGHTIQVNCEAGSSITIDETTFTLKQFHFHSPSENTIDGRSFPLEAHLVHADANGNLAVIGVLFDVGETNNALSTFWPYMPENAGSTNVVTDVMINAEALIPEDQDYYRYNGSLTTPPCTEGVRWLVIKEVGQVALSQVDAFMHTVHHANNRPVQAINARAVLK